MVGKFSSRARARAGTRGREDVQVCWEFVFLFDELRHLRGSERFVRAPRSFRFQGSSARTRESLTSARQLRSDRFHLIASPVPPPVPPCISNARSWKLWHRTLLAAWPGVNSARGDAGRVINSLSRYICISLDRRQFRGPSRSMVFQRERQITRQRREKGGGMGQEIRLPKYVYQFVLEAE